MQLRKVCNHPNMFEVRPTISPFQMELLLNFSTERWVIGDCNCNCLFCQPAPKISNHAIAKLVWRLRLGAKSKFAIMPHTKPEHANPALECLWPCFDTNNSEAFNRNGFYKFFSLISVGVCCWLEPHCRTIWWNCGPWCTSLCLMCSHRTASSRSGSPTQWRAWLKATWSTTRLW